MSKELKAFGVSGSITYAVVYNAAAQVWNASTSTFENENDSHFAMYGIPVPEVGTLGFFNGNFPSTINTAGEYPVEFRTQGASTGPQLSDFRFAVGVVPWTGMVESFQFGGSTSNALNLPIDNTGLPIVDGSGGSGATPQQIDAQLSSTHGSGPWGGISITGQAASPGQPAIDGTLLEATVNYPFTATFTIGGLSFVGWTQFDFTVKKTFSNSDAQALLFVSVSSPAEGTDGLVLLNGATPASASYGSLSVNSVSPSTIVTLNLSAAGMAIPTALLAYHWELTGYISTVKQPVVARGQFATLPAVRLTTSQE